MSLQMRRVLVGLISAGLGILITAGIVYLWIPVDIPVMGTAGRPDFHIGFGTTPEDFAYSNVLLIFLSIAAFFGIWLDYFLNTEILKS